MINDALMSDQGFVEKDFYKLFSEVQEFISINYPSLISDEADAKEQIKNTIRKYLYDNRKIAKDMTVEQVTDRIYCEMSEMSILTPLLDSNRTDIEEININAWDDIKVNYIDGKTETLTDHFYSPNHCRDVILRLLKKESEMILDLSHPIQRGHLNNKIRITVMGEGVIDRSAGISCSMRIINPRKLKRENFIQNGTATDGMLTLLSVLLRYGISMCITGETNSGKTTLMSWLLSTIQNSKRVFSIEEDVREFDLIKRDEDGVVLNNVIHTRTKKSDDPSKIIDQDKLLETALTMNPDVICVSEMKGKEANAAQEAARTGHTVITTTHANSCRATYKRMVTLCKKAVDMDEKTLFELVKDAFPIIAYIKKDDDNVRRIKEITECISDEETSKTRISTLYEFRVRENIENEQGEITEVKGEYVKVNEISESLRHTLIANGISSSVLKNLLKNQEGIA